MTTPVPLWRGVLVGVAIGFLLATIGYAMLMVFIANKSGAKAGE